MLRSLVGSEMCIRDRTRPYFTMLRELFERFGKLEIPGVEMRYLSMGMSDDYLVALVFLGDRNRVVTSALAAMVGEKGQDWHLLTSGAFVSMILPLTVFFALQRFFVRGMMAGSVKG